MSTSGPLRHCACPFVLLILATVPSACADAPNVVQPDRGSSARPLAARSSTALAVSSTNPSFADQGTTLDVHVYGSGFAAGAQATWLLHGAADPAQVRTNSTSVISSTELVANITIASDATLDFWDVQVALSNGKNGVGSDLFEVTTAIPIGTLGGSSEARSARGSTVGTQIVGWSEIGGVQHAFAWPDASGNMEDLGPGFANAIDLAGITIAGSNGSDPVIWTKAASGWTETKLPVLAGTPPGSQANAILSGADGRAIIIGGMESFTYKQSNPYRPMLWVLSAGAWVRTPLPLPRTGPAAGAVHDINVRRQAVGGVRSSSLPTQGVFWDSLGAAHVLPGDGYHATAIDPTGSVIAGALSGGSLNSAVYWTAQINADGSRVWSGPFPLPGGCKRANAMDDAGDIVGDQCTLSSTSSSTGAIWVPPYASVTTLTGLGDPQDQGSAWAISRDGSLVVGSAPTGASGMKRLAVQWRGVVP